MNDRRKRSKKCCFRNAKVKRGKGADPNLGQYPSSNHFDLVEQPGERSHRSFFEINLLGNEGYRIAAIHTGDFVDLRSACGVGSGSPPGLE